MDQSPPVHQRRREMVGHVVELAAGLETWMGVLLSQLTGGPVGEPALRVQAMIEGESISWVLGKLRVAACSLDVAEAALLNGFADDVAEAMRRRNQVVHGIVVLIDDGASAEWRRAQRGKTARRMPADTDELTSLVAMLERLSARLHRDLCPALDVRLSLPPGRRDGEGLA